jgi:signal transduction histidine kinase
MREFNKAARFYQKGLSYEKLKYKNPGLYAMLLSNLAYTKLMQKNMSNVKEMLFKSYKIRDSLKINLGVISSKYYIGQYYLTQKDTLKALENILSCYNLSKKVKSNPDVLNSLKLLIEIDSKNKNFYAGEYFRVSDSLQQAERATRNKFARIEFETDQVEKENQLLSKKNTFIITETIVLLSIAGVFFMLYRLKTKNKELKLIQVQQNKNEEIYKLLLNQQSISEESRKEERNRISKELHDGVVNSIFTTRFNLMQLEPSQSDKKNQLVKELEKTELEIRRVSHELNKNLDFNDDSIVKMLNDLVKAQKNEWNTKFTISVDKLINWNTIDSETKMNIYRIIQEILQNVNKYAKAKQCIVMILKTNKKTTIRIWDNGIGFNPEKVKKGIGLKNIQDRAAAIKGALNINSNDNNGTTIEIEF